MGDTLRSIHWRVAGRQLRPASQARAEPRLLRRGCGFKEAAVQFLGRLNGANGAAINPGGGHAHEEQAIKTLIASDERPVKGFGVTLHMNKLHSGLGPSSPFSDTELFFILMTESGEQRLWMWLSFA